jgi:hypothetical protein
MAWERGKGGGRYYTRTKRVGGRFVREYFGRGPRAEQAAAEDARRRAERRAQAEALGAEQRRYADAVGPLLELCRLSDLLVRATLTSVGYHQHDRGAWRRKRHVRDDDNPTGAEGLPGGGADDPATGQRR